MGDAAPFLPLRAASAAREANRLRLVEDPAGTPTHALPAQPTPLIGRGEEVGAARGYVTAGVTRLLTFVGPGGAGKTRLAVEVAASLAGEFEDAIFVDLAPVQEADLVMPAIAEALGVRETGREPLIQSVQHTLRDRHVLLVLDNFEHVTGAAVLVAALLERCPRLTVLATSRVPLELRWEQVFSVPPLAVPTLLPLPALEALSAVPAVALFVSRAQAVKREFVLDERNARAVAELCVRLDGLPLAIELAASRTRTYPPPVLLSRLQQGADVLSGGPRDLPVRHQALRNTMAWSYDLLVPREQALFRRLGVFAGGWTLEAAAAVCAGDANDEAVSGEDVSDVLEALHTHSLVQQQEDDDGERRFTMLETVREYALEQAEAAGEAEASRRRHADYLLALAEQAESEVRGPRESEWLDRLTREQDNLRSALQWLIGRGEAERACRLTGALWPFWDGRGYWTEGRERLTEALALARGQGRHSTVAKALFGAATLARRQGDYAAAGPLYAECLDRWQALGDTRWIARTRFAIGVLASQRGERDTAQAHLAASLAMAQQAGDERTAADALHSLGTAAAERGDYAAARCLVERSLALCRSLQDLRGVASSLLDLGVFLSKEGDLRGARTRYEESLQLFRQLGSKLGLTIAANNLGHLACKDGDFEAAQQFFEESLRLQRVAGDRAGLARSLANLGMVALARGELAAAQDLYAQSLRLRHALESKVGIAGSLEGLASVATAASRWELALRLAAAAAALREAAGVPLSGDEEAALVRALDVAHRGLGQQASVAAWVRGTAAPLAEVVTDALAANGAEEVAPSGRDAAPSAAIRPRAARKVGSPQPQLTPREREVALLVAQGFTNAQIAERLVVTKGTAAIHVEHIREKLGFHARAQIASWVAVQDWASPSPPA